MNVVTHVVLPPNKPILVFDGDCNFCRRWIARWREMTGDLVEYHPFQDAYITERFPEIPREQFESAVQLIEPDGRVCGGAQAVFRTLGYAPHKRWTLWAYENIFGVDAFTEFWYRVVAQNRAVFSWLTRLLWGDHVERPRYLLARWVFLRFLGFIYLFAFASLWTQIGGLVGHNGILPADQMMRSVHQQVDKQQIGFARYYLLPTLCWINSSDQFLNLLCGAGTVLSILLIAGVAPAPVLFLLWLIYLSLSTVCREFLSFQWDILLLETGFLAIFFAPLQMLPRLSRRSAAVADDALAVALVVVSVDVRFRRGKARQRRPDLAQPDRADLSLRNAAAADLDWMVREPVAGLVPETVLRGDVRHRTRCAVPDFSAAPATDDRMRSADLPAIVHHRDRQLLLLQSAGDCDVPVVAG